MQRQIFVNLSVKDLEKSMEFFSKLNFKFNPQFTDKNAACMIISENNIYAMLLTEKSFKSFIKKEIANTKKDTEVILALTCESKKEVDEIFDKVIKAGGKEARESTDHGWMYIRAFEDLDGHIWEIFWMDPNHIIKS